MHLKNKLKNKRRDDWDHYGRDKLASICWASSLSYFKNRKGKSHLNPQVRDQPQELKIRKNNPSPKEKPH